MTIKKNYAGFTLLEIIVVLGIIALLTGVIIASVDNIQEKGRNARRVADISQIQNALALYYRDEGSYPSSLTFGSALMGSTSSTTYMGVVPNNPNPRDDGECDNINYSYVLSSGRYKIGFCLGGNSGEINTGDNCALPTGIINSICE